MPVFIGATKKEFANKTERINEIKRLLGLLEVAESKYRYNFDGTKVQNRMQIAAATRLFNRARKIAEEGNISDYDFILIHNKVVEDFKKKNRKS
jgi:hypothetical protein